MNYDRQVVISIPTGRTDAALNAVKDAAQTLHHKHAAQSALITWRPDGIPLESLSASPAAINGLTNNSRVYVVSHGNPNKLAGLSANDLAKLLWKVGGIRAAKRIVLVACCVGEESSDPFKSLLKDAPAFLGIGETLLEISYAQMVHKVLGNEYQLYVELAARTEISGVNGQGQKITTAVPSPPNWSHKKPGTKVVWSWDAARQKQVEARPY